VKVKKFTIKSNEKNMLALLSQILYSACSKG
jgi:hypothetical protein